LLQHFPPELVSEATLDRIIDDIVQGHYYCFPIGAWLALNLGVAYMQKLYSKVPVTCKYCQTPFWGPWSVYSLFYFGGEVWRFIISFLVRSELRELLGMIEFISRLLAKPPDDIKLAVMDIFADLLLKSEHRGSLAVLFFNLVREYLFCQPTSLIESVWGEISPWPGNSRRAPLNYPRPSVHKPPLTLNIARTQATRSQPITGGVHRRRTAKWSSVGQLSEDGATGHREGVISVTPFEIDDFIDDYDTSRWSFSFAVRLDPDMNW
jgi:hypothetical protein